MSRYRMPALSNRARLLTLIVWVAGCSTPPEFDILITDALVLTGDGTAARASDVGVRDGKIVAIGELGDKAAERVIEAAGRVVAPGFIDVHTHVESRNHRQGIEGIPRADNFLLDGVTTIIRQLRLVRTAVRRVV